jgi:hypothetical protein
MGTGTGKGKGKEKTPVPGFLWNSKMPGAPSSEAGILAIESALAIPDEPEPKPEAEAGGKFVTVSEASAQPTQVEMLPAPLDRPIGGEFGGEEFEELPDRAGALAAQPRSPRRPGVSSFVGAAAREATPPPSPPRRGGARKAIARRARRRRRRRPARRRRRRRRRRKPARRRRPARRPARTAKTSPRRRRTARAPTTPTC